ncbi:hypothetical protein FB561_6104 [Kribbella amoyensis]|uniref:Lipoprotein n=1 Tax=Kribbella amoyensis TaxID=996641 RepID=A0A561C1D8_9ACTN|nr:hypothetical protein [Kribbella amoyensis]TWD84908.1 hypothetical protein FB561_6104 [Kribbella amoyensis]
MTTIPLAIIRKAACLLAASAVLVSCAPAPPAGAPEPSATPTVDRWRPSTADQRVLEAAEDLVLSQCMSRAGFTFRAVTIDRPNDRSYPYAIDDVDWARSHGYGIADDVAARAVRRPDPNLVALRAMTPAERQQYLEALNGSGRTTVTVGAPSGGTAGTNADGCTAEARRTLFGDHDGWFRASTVAVNLDSAVIVPEVVRSPRLRPALERWSNCLRTKGFADRDPLAARDRIGELAGRVDLDRLRRDEQAVAVAEAECSVRSGYVATAERLDRELGAPIRRKNSDALQQYRRLATAALPKARAIIAAR